MEEGRLKPMVANYDKEMFNRLYAKTEALRHKLARQIDPRRFGLPYDEIYSFFNVKFIYVFNKYYGEPENILQAKLINAMQNFKQRILRKAYTLNHTQNIVAVEELVYFEDSLREEHPENVDRDFYYNKIMTFMRSHLSDNAFVLFEVQLNPPPYIINRINPGKESNLQRIPDDVLLEYFSLGLSDKAYKYLHQLKKEIRNAVNYAKSSFKSS